VRQYRPVSGFGIPAWRQVVACASRLFFRRRKLFEQVRPIASDNAACFVVDGPNDLEAFLDLPHLFLPAWRRTFSDSFSAGECGCAKLVLKSSSECCSYLNPAKITLPPLFGTQYRAGGFHAAEGLVTA